METLNGKIIYQENTTIVDNTTFVADTIDYNFQTTGTSLITLPAISGEVFNYHIFVKSGTCQLTGVVDGLTNQVLKASVQEISVYCNGTAYFIITNGKDNLLTNNRPQSATIQNYTQAGVITINTILMTIDCSDATAISISCNAMGTTGVATPRWINEIGDTGQPATIITPAGVTALTFNAVGMWVTPVVARYLTLVLTTATTAGTTTLRASKLFGAIPSQLIPAIGTQAVSGSVTVSGSLTSAGTTTNTPATPTASNINSTATTNASSIKTSAGTLYNAIISNTGASTRYVKFYNKASAPTVGTDIPIITIAIPTNGTIQANMGVLGHRFATGIALAITGGATDADTTAVGANEVKVLTSYI